ncbi:MAG: beta-N-acetylglucosaminidase, partial [Verrucomicrobiota bacterium]
MTSSPLITGVVEGFYGRPWSAAQRRELIGR